MPVSHWGRLFASFTMVWGLMIIAMPVGIISNNFGKVWQAYEEERAAKQSLRARGGGEIEKRPSSLAREPRQAGSFGKLH